MEIRSLCICDHYAGGFWNSTCGGQSTTKTLPWLSIVQSVRGSYRVAIDHGSTYETGPMGVFVAPENTHQSITHIAAEDGTMDAQWVFINVEINRQYTLDTLFTYPTILPAEHNEKIYECLGAVRKETAFFKQLHALERLVEILLLYATPKPPLPEEALSIKHYVEKNYMQPITAEDLMSVLHISRSSLYRLFQEHFGKAPSHYINHVRIRQAQLLLSNTNKSISEIAAAVGYTRIGYFSRLFHRIVGESARDYRERNGM